MTDVLHVLTASVVRATMAQYPRIQSRSSSPGLFNQAYDKQIDFVYYRANAVYITVVSSSSCITLTLGLYNDISQLSRLCIVERLHDLWMMKWKVCGRKRPWSFVWHYSNISLVALRKTTKTIRYQPSGPRFEPLLRPSEEEFTVCFIARTSCIITLIKSQTQGECIFTHSLFLFFLYFFSCPLNYSGLIISHL